MTTIQPSAPLGEGQAKAAPRDCKHGQLARTCQLCDLEAEEHILRYGGIIEVAVRNANVAEYMGHWEGRALKAEAKLAESETPPSGETPITDAEIVRGPYLDRGTDSEYVPAAVSRQLELRAVAAEKDFMQVHKNCIAAREKAESLSDELERARIHGPDVRTIDALRDAEAEVARLRSALQECAAWFADRADVVDGDYGVPQANAAMQMLGVCDAALARATGKGGENG